MKIGIILAAGKGTRVNSNDKNKTTLKVNNKPLVEYGVDLFEATMDQTIVVIGAFSQSVKQVLKNRRVLFELQTEQKGTGHAAKVALTQIHNLASMPTEVFLGYGDHMMYYQPDTLATMLAEHQRHRAAITLITTHHTNPVSLAWGRIVRDVDGFVERIVEQKDATPQELVITELNAGFYCFDFAFIARELEKLKPSPITGEYYLTDLIETANRQGLKVVPVAVPFSKVGSGVNTAEQLAATDKDLRHLPT